MLVINFLLLPLFGLLFLSFNFNLKTLSNRRKCGAAKQVKWKQAVDPLMAATVTLAGVAAFVYRQNGPSAHTTLMRNIRCVQTDPEQGGNPISLFEN